MSLAVAWTPEAQETFDDTIIQIESKWGTRSAEKFVRETNKIIGMIQSQPYLFKSSYTTNIRQAIVSKQTSMFYEVHSSHHNIVFLG